MEEWRHKDGYGDIDRSEFNKTPGEALIEIVDQLASLREGGWSENVLLQSKARKTFQAVGRLRFAERSRAGPTML